MKTIAIIGVLALCAAGAYAQGLLQLDNNLSGQVITHIYSPSPGSPNVQVTGNTSTEYPVGTQVYTGTPIGGSSGAAGLPVNYAYGNNFTVEIYALGEDDTTDNSPSGDGGLNPLYNGKNTLFSSLMPVTQYTSTMGENASQGAGFIVTINPANDPGIPWSGYNVPNDSLDTVAAISLVCWYNAGGTISLATARADQYPWGASPVFIANNLGEPTSVTEAYNGTQATQPGALRNLRSFGLTQAPEPSTIALGVMGAFAFLARRRKQ